MADRTQNDPSSYRSLHHLRHGGLHDALHVSQDDKIPADKLEAATHSKNAHVKKMAVLAKNMKSWKH